MPPRPPADPRSISVRRSGRGRPLLMSHGFGDSAATWTGLCAFLEPHFETHRWDLLGHGDSARPEAPEHYSRERALADLDGVIESANGDVVLIGHSLGGYLSQCRVINEPAGIRALVLIASGPGFSDPKRREQWNRYVGRAKPRYAVPRAATRLAEQHDDLVMANLGRIRLPVLQIVGERDSGYHGAFEYLKRRIDGIESRMIPGAGHHVHRSHSREVGDAILSFLEGVA